MEMCIIRREGLLMGKGKRKGMGGEGMMCSESLITIEMYLS